MALSAHPDNPALVQVLKDFRVSLERELEQPITSLELPALLILDDLCTFVRADPSEVLVKKAVRLIKHITG